MPVVDEFILKTHGLAEKAANEVESAKADPVDSEASFQVSDTIQADQKKRLKEIGDERLSLTRVIDDFKQVVLDAEKSVTSHLNEAITIRQSKMLSYRLEVQQKAQKAQRESERILQEAKQRELERARKLEERAELLKTDSAKQRLYQEADSIKQTTVMMPDAVTSAAAEPKTVAST